MVTVLGLYSSHPSNTQIGFYWAVDQRGSLIISTRGNILDYDLLTTNENKLLGDIVGELKSRRLFKVGGALRLVPVVE